MDGLEEIIAREYFEQNGFLVRRVSTPWPAQRKKQPEGSDLMVVRCAAQPPERPPGFFLFSSELPLLRQAVILIRGWHALRSPPIPRTSAQIHRFITQTVMKTFVEKENLLNEPPNDVTGWLKILLLPHLPTAEPFRTQIVEILQAARVGGVISFRAMLSDLVGRAELDGPADRSAVPGTIRLLRQYDLLRDSQLDLFSS